MSWPRLYQAVQSSIAGPLHRQVRERIAAAIPDAPRVRVLDLGCGVGDYAALFTRAQYHGLDIDPRYVAAARRSFPGDNITFAVGDARVLAFPDRAFDPASAWGSTTTSRTPRSSKVSARHSA
jgi:ubiquinone/menaquinone biosynthesis C-methylase UbiE